MPPPNTIPSCLHREATARELLGLGLEQTHEVVQFLDKARASYQPGVITRIEKNICPALTTHVRQAMRLKVRRNLRELAEQNVQELTDSNRQLECKQHLYVLADESPERIRKLLTLAKTADDSGLTAPQRIATYRELSRATNRELAEWIQSVCSDRGEQAPPRLTRLTKRELIGIWLRLHGWTLKNHFDRWEREARMVEQRKEQNAERRQHQIPYATVDDNTKYDVELYP